MKRESCSCPRRFSAGLSLTQLLRTGPPGVAPPKFSQKYYVLPGNQQLKVFDQIRREMAAKNARPPPPPPQRPAPQLEGLHQVRVDNALHEFLSISYQTPDEQAEVENGCIKLLELVIPPVLRWSSKQCCRFNFGWSEIRVVLESWLL